MKRFACGLRVIYRLPRRQTQGLMHGVAAHDELTLTTNVFRIAKHASELAA
jgi:hypothetical protein